VKLASDMLGLLGLNVMSVGVVGWVGVTPLWVTVAWVVRGERGQEIYT